MGTALVISAVAILATLFLALVREAIRTEVDYLDKLLLHPMLEEIRMLRQAVERAVGKRRRGESTGQPRSGPDGLGRR